MSSSSDMNGDLFGSENDDAQLQNDIQEAPAYT